VNARLTELYDYDELRTEHDATFYVVHPERATLVLGSTQSTDLLNPEHLEGVPLRRRRGGGGLVLVQPATSGSIGGFPRATIAGAVTCTRVREWSDNGGPMC